MEDEDFEEEFEVEEYDAEELEEDTTEAMRPELKKLYQQHPECLLDYVEQVLPKIPLQTTGDKTDANHVTYPFLTQFERTKIIGRRANQLSRGAVPFVAVPKHVTDVREIARLELDQKRLPYLIKRPLPNGTFEYWRLVDLLLL
jgi:DNA-directed RNA polymerase I, II, and III subunit RPABC2